MKSLPQSYALLQRWFPRLTDRAAALGLSRQTLTTWERAPADACVRAATARLVDRLAMLAGDVEERVGDPESAGVWIGARQPLAQGRTPVDLLRTGEVDTLRRLIFPADVGRPVRQVAIDRDQMLGRQTALPVVARERPREAGEAAVLRRIGEREELIRSGACLSSSGAGASRFDSSRSSSSRTD